MRAYTPRITAKLIRLKNNCDRASSSTNSIDATTTNVKTSVNQLSHGYPHIRSRKVSGASDSSRRRIRSWEPQMIAYTNKATAPAELMMK
jgi:hypothetical protein